jgi:aminoglycoside phosphotransferase (APT) family kinase protein
MRNGDTVRRPGQPWNKDVHQLLRHIRDRGFLLAPQPMGFDERGREILSYIEGDTSASVDPWPGPLWSDALLADVGRTVAAYHRAVADFVPDADARWQYRPRPLEPGEIICHHDFAHYNAVFKDHQLRGIIDWDGAGPGTIQEELAFLAWQWVPLGPPDLKEHMGCDPLIDEGARLRLLLDSYGYQDREGLLDAVIERIEISRSGIELRAAAGDLAYVALRDEGYTRGMERTIEYVTDRNSRLQAEIE